MRHGNTIGRKRIATLTGIGWLVIGLSCPVAVLADGASVVPSNARKIVAAGFGIQDAESSSITVKTYDAESGEVLSDETYELDIKEERTAVPGQPRERIFAGGVGIGVDGLSGFTLRVYDAADGRFLWEGRLNLGVTSHDAETVPVASVIQPRSVVSLISRHTAGDGQPSFLLRVLDPQTKQLMWSDRFSAATVNARIERIGRSIVGMAPVSTRDVEFRIQMFDEVDRRLLWEDQVTPATDEGDTSPELQEEDAEVIGGFYLARSILVSVLR